MKKKTENTIEFDLAAVLGVVSGVVAEVLTVVLGVVVLVLGVDLGVVVLPVLIVVLRVVVAALFVVFGVAAVLADVDVLGVEVVTMEDDLAAAARLEVVLAVVLAAVVVIFGVLVGAVFVVFAEPGILAATRSLFTAVTAICDAARVMK